VAIDPDSGATYISYYKDTTDDLMVATRVGPGGNCGAYHHWQCDTVDSGGDVGKESSIAIDPAHPGVVGIAYHDATHGQLKYARGTGCPQCTWLACTIDVPLQVPGSVGYYTSLKYSSTGTARIAHYAHSHSEIGALIMTVVPPDYGNCSQIDEFNEEVQAGFRVGQHASLAVDGDGKSHMAYYDGGNGDLWYAGHAPDPPGNCGWFDGRICYPVDDVGNVGQYASIGVDNGDVPHIAYYDKTTGKLMHAMQVPVGGNCGVQGDWQCDEIDSVGTSTHPRDVSLAMDPDGQPIIAYHKYIVGDLFTIRSLNVARPAAAAGQLVGNCGPGSSWWCDRIPDPGHSGDWLSIALHPSGLATVAYFNSEYFGMLRVAYQGYQLFIPATSANYRTP
jgi:hypothetical protein